MIRKSRKQSNKCFKVLNGDEKILAYNIDQVTQIVLQQFFMISLNNQAVLLNKISQSDHTKMEFRFPAYL